MRLLRGGAAEGGPGRQRAAGLRLLLGGAAARGLLPLRAKLSLSEPAGCGSNKKGYPKWNHRLKPGKNKIEPQTKRAKSNKITQNGAPVIGTKDENRRSNSWWCNFDPSPGHRVPLFDYQADLNPGVTHFSQEESPWVLVGGHRNNPPKWRPPQGSLLKITATEVVCGQKSPKTPTGSGEDMI